MAVREKGGGGSDILERVRSTLLRHRMVSPAETVVAGVSGGLDSVSLLDLLVRLQGEFRLRLVVAHLHHGLRREEGEQEFRFVEELASRYGLPFEGRRIDPADYAGGGNVQARARRLRLRFFEEVARKFGAGRIATGHHRDDHVETLLMQMLRGTGGLVGIRPVRDGRYIRPLIELSGESIRAYAFDAALPFREDSSNRKRAYLRNRIRRELIPWIRREVNPSFGDSLLQLASILQEEAACLDALAAEAFGRVTRRAIPEVEVVLRRDLLETLPRALQRRVLRLSYGRLEGSMLGLSYGHTEGICDALESSAGRVHKVFSMPRGIRVFLEYDALYMTRRDLWEVTPYEIPLPGESEKPIPVPEAGIALTVERHRVVSGGPPVPEDPGCALLDAERATGRMVVRNARPGDRFRPTGSGGSKKIKDFFIDEKIPRSLRRRIAILEIGGKVAWVVGYRMDDRFKASGDTRTVMRLRSVPYDRGEGTRV